VIHFEDGEFTPMTAEMLVPSDWFFAPRVDSNPVHRRVWAKRQGSRSPSDVHSFDV
jgi:hypothetical protein